MKGHISKSVDFWAQSFYIHRLLSPLVFLSRFFSCIFLFLQVSAPDAVSFCCCCFTPLFPLLSLPFLKALHPFLLSLTLFSHFWKISSDNSPITYNSDTGKCMWTSSMWRLKGVQRSLRDADRRRKQENFSFLSHSPWKVVLSPTRFWQGTANAVGVKPEMTNCSRKDTCRFRRCWSLDGQGRKVSPCQDDKWLLFHLRIKRKTKLKA